MMGSDTPETCGGWWNILRISLHQVGFPLHDASIYPLIFPYERGTITAVSKSNEMCSRCGILLSGDFFDWSKCNIFGRNVKKVM
jgi:hypothetical protein